MAPHNFKNKEQEKDERKTSRKPSTGLVRTKGDPDCKNKQYAKGGKEFWSNDLVELLEQRPMVLIGLFLAILIIGIAIGGIIHPFSPLLP